MKIGRMPRIPDIDVGGYNLCKEVLRWLDLLINNPMDKERSLREEAKLSEGVPIPREGVNLHGQ